MTDATTRVQHLARLLYIGEAPKRSCGHGVFRGDRITPHRPELTWLRDHKESYDLRENEFHLVFETDDFAAAHKKHDAMACVCYDNPGTGIYFISDPDGYWLEILPKK